MGIGRKGIFLSLSALLFVGVLFAVFTPLEQRDIAPESRLQVEEMVQRTQTLESSELGVWLEHSARTTLNRLARQEASEPFLFVEESDVQEAFRGCVLDGSCFDQPPLQGEESQQELPRVVPPPLTTLEQLEDFYRDLGYDHVNITLQDVSIQPRSVRTLEVEGTFDIEFVDSTTRSAVRRTSTVQRVISIEGLYDPIALREENLHSRILFPSRSLTRGSAEDFLEHARTGTYAITNASHLGFTYLERFTASPQASQQNSIHFIFPPGYYGTQERSYVDFRVFLPDEELCLLGVRDDDSWVYIESRLALFYGFSVADLSMDAVQEAGNC